MVFVTIDVVKNSDHRCRYISLACRAFGRFWHEVKKVRQIISKLPMFTDGQIQALMKRSNTSRKRGRNMLCFKKYALELMGRVSGEAKPTGAEYEISLASLHRAKCSGTNKNTI